jgi:hypothetical protein
MKNLFYNTMAATEMHVCVGLAEITISSVLTGRSATSVIFLSLYF